MNEWFWMCSGAGGAAMNMAADEALLLTAEARGRPALRFYEWTEPAATFGYFQHYTDVENATTLRPLVRRPTGGGIVPHDADWTYCVCIPQAHEWYGVVALESYRRMHQWVAEALGACGVAAELARESSKPVIGQCFIGFEQYDVLWKGRKIAGAAQRRTKSGLLIQGSVQPFVEWSRAAWERAMREVGARDQGIVWTGFEPDNAFQDVCARLAREKYSRDEFNRKR